MGYYQKTFKDFRTEAAFMAAVHPLRQLPILTAVFSDRMPTDGALTRESVS